MITFLIKDSSHCIMNNNIDGGYHQIVLGLINYEWSKMFALIYYVWWIPSLGNRFILVSDSGGPAIPMTMEPLLCGCAYSEVILLSLLTIFDVYYYLILIDPTLDSIVRVFGSYSMIRSPYPMIMLYGISWTQGNPPIFNTIKLNCQVILCEESYII